VHADDIKSLRKELGITQRDLAEALSLEVSLVRAWESGEQFATRAHCDALERLRANPPPRRARRSASAHETLSDPAFWTLHRKLLAHPALRAACDKIATEYEDPLETERSK
jgi:transcriptional regulator with XRE-family HTH domain